MAQDLRSTATLSAKHDDDLLYKRISYYCAARRFRSILLMVRWDSWSSRAKERSLIYPRASLGERNRSL